MEMEIISLKIQARLNSLAMHESRTAIRLLLQLMMFLTAARSFIQAER